MIYSVSVGISGKNILRCQNLFCHFCIHFQSSCQRSSSHSVFCVNVCTFIDKISNDCSFTFVYGKSKRCNTVFIALINIGSCCQQLGKGFFRSSVHCSCVEYRISIHIFNGNVPIVFKKQTVNCVSVALRNNQ